MKKLLKNIGKTITEKINVDTKRILNNRKITVPVINGVKVGVSSEKWMSGVLKELFDFSPSGVFYDVGVNLGQTLIKVMTLNDRMRYVGFEPNPSCLFYLQRIISKNNWSNTMIVPVGLSDSDCLLQLFGSYDTDPGSTTIRELRPGATYISKLVPVFRFESIKQNISHDNVAVVKIDVEGAELEVIHSISLLIEKDRPVIILEVLPNKGIALRESRNKEMAYKLKQLKYSFYRIIKTSHDTYAGVSRIDDIGSFSDPVLKDHLVVPDEKVKDFEKMLTIVATRTP